MKRTAMSLTALAAGATIGCFCRSVEYVSTATVELVPATPRVVVGARPSMMEAYLQSMAAIARSPRVLAAATRPPPEWQAGLSAGLEPDARELGESIGTETLGAGVIDVSCQLADPSLTALAAHAVADSFVDVVAEQDSSRQRIKSLAETGASLASELAARESGLAEGPEAESELLDLRAKLGLIRSRIENLEIEGANGPRAQVIVRAPTPTEPFRSSRGSLAGLGALIGLALGAGGTAVPSRRVRSRDDGGTR